MAAQHTVGVLALQGGVREHLTLLKQLGTTAVPVRTAADLRSVDALVLPGGESSTIDRLTRIVGIAAELQEAIAAGLPTLGTCAGLIMLADTITDPAPGQQSLRQLPVTVDRNAFGSQVFSATAELAWRTPGNSSVPVRAAFIRAPRIVSAAAGVTVTAEYQGETVGVRYRNMLGISFHPELTGDPTVHQELLSLI